MSWLVTAPAIQERLAALDLGSVYLGDVYVKDRSIAKRLFRYAGLASNKDAYRGFRVVRDKIQEARYSQLRNYAVEDYTIRVIQTDYKRVGSERDFQEMLEAAVATFGTIGHIGSAHILTAPATPTVTHATYAGESCHYAEIGIQVEEYCTIVPNQAPTQETSLAVSRSIYRDVSAQLGALLSLADESGRVHGERPWVETEESRFNSYLVPNPEKPGAQRVETWTLYRESDQQTREIGNRLVGETEWRLMYHRSLKDPLAVVNSYSATQEHLDVVRGLFRGNWNLGSIYNPTLVHSSPLQVRSFGARWISHILTHFVDCRLETRTQIHAPLEAA